MQTKTYTQEEINEIMAGMEQVNLNTYGNPPICHFKKMVFNQNDDPYQTEMWWECSVCGHTKEIE